MGNAPSTEDAQFNGQSRNEMFMQAQFPSSRWEEHVDGSPRVETWPPSQSSGRAARASFDVSPNGRGASLSPPPRKKQRLDHNAISPNFDQITQADAKPAVPSRCPTTSRAFDYAEVPKAPKAMSQKASWFDEVTLDNTCGPHIFIPAASLPTAKDMKMHLSKYLFKTGIRPKTKMTPDGHYLFFPDTQKGDDDLLHLWRKCDGQQLFSMYELQMQIHPQHLRPPGYQARRKGGDTFITRDGTSPKAKQSASSLLQPRSSFAVRQSNHGTGFVSTTRTSEHVTGLADVEPERLSLKFRRITDSTTGIPTNSPSVALGQPNCNATVIDNASEASYTPMRVSSPIASAVTPIIPEPILQKSLQEGGPSSALQLRSISIPITNGHIRKDDDLSSNRSITPSEVSSSIIRELEKLCYACRQGDHALNPMQGCSTCWRRFHETCRIPRPQASEFGSKWHCKHCIKRNRHLPPLAKAIPEPPSIPPNMPKPPMWDLLKALTQNDNTQDALAPIIADQREKTSDARPPAKDRNASITEARYSSADHLSHENQPGTFGSEIDHASVVLSEDSDVSMSMSDSPVAATSGRATPPPAENSGEQCAPPEGSGERMMDISDSVESAQRRSPAHPSSQDPTAKLVNAALFQPRPQTSADHLKARSGSQRCTSCNKKVFFGKDTVCRKCRKPDDKPRDPEKIDSPWIEVLSTLNQPTAAQSPPQKKSSGFPKGKSGVVYTSDPLLRRTFTGRTSMKISKRAPSTSSAAMALHDSFQPGTANAAWPRQRKDIGDLAQNPRVSPKSTDTKSAIIEGPTKAMPVIHSRAVTRIVDLEGGTSSEDEDAMRPPPPLREAPMAVVDSGAHGCDETDEPTDTSSASDSDIPLTLLAERRRIQSLSSHATDEPSPVFLRRVVSLSRRKGAIKNARALSKALRCEYSVAKNAFNLLRLKKYLIDPRASYLFDPKEKRKRPYVLTQDSETCKAMDREIFGLVDSAPDLANGGGNTSSSSDAPSATHGQYPAGAHQSSTAVTASFAPSAKINMPQSEEDAVMQDSLLQPSDIASRQADTSLTNSSPDSEAQTLSSDSNHRYDLGMPRMVEPNSLRELAAEAIINARNERVNAKEAVQWVLARGYTKFAANSMGWQKSVQATMCGVRTFIRTATQAGDNNLAYYSFAPGQRQKYLHLQREEAVAAADSPDDVAEGSAKNPLPQDRNIDQVQDGVPPKYAGHLPTGAARKISRPIASTSGSFASEDGVSSSPTRAQHRIKHSRQYRPLRDDEDEVSFIAEDSGEPECASAVHHDDEGDTVLTPASHDRKRGDRTIQETQAARLRNSPTHDKHQDHKYGYTFELSDTDPDEALKILAMPDKPRDYEYEAILREHERLNRFFHADLFDLRPDLDPDKRKNVEANRRGTTARLSRGELKSMRKDGRYQGPTSLLIDSHTNRSKHAQDEVMSEEERDMDADISRRPRDFVRLPGEEINWRKCGSIGDVLNMPALTVAFIDKDGDLAFRDGTMVDGVLPRLRQSWKVGKIEEKRARRNG